MHVNDSNHQVGFGQSGLGCCREVKRRDTGLDMEHDTTTPSLSIHCPISSARYSQTNFSSSLTSCFVYHAPLGCSIISVDGTLPTLRIIRRQCSCIRPSYGYTLSYPRHHTLLWQTCLPLLHDAKVYCDSCCCCCCCRCPLSVTGCGVCDPRADPIWT